MNKKKEEEFICKLRSNKLLYELANKILFKYIKFAIETDLPKEKIINHIKLDFKDKYILKNGYVCDKYDCNFIFNLKNYKELMKYNIDHNITLLQIMGACYKFQINNHIVLYFIKKDNVLKNKIIKTFNQYFNTNYDFDQIDNIVNKSKGKWFYSWIHIYLYSNVKNIVHRNVINDEDYIRKGQYHKSIKTIKPNDCLKKQYPKEVNHDNVISGNSKYMVIDNGIFMNIMKDHNKNYIAGFSRKYSNYV
jgi:hypothetical protein